MPFCRGTILLVFSHDFPLFSLGWHVVQQVSSNIRTCVHRDVATMDSIMYVISEDCLNAILTLTDNFETIVAILRKVRKDVQRMVTVDFLEKEVLKGKDVEDLEESELKEMQEMYLVVTVPVDFEPYTEEGVELNEEKLEEQKVEASPEFEAATEIYNNTVSGVASSILFGIIFLILLTRKLDGQFGGSWWAVFAPIFFERGFRWLYNIHRCACGRMAGDEIAVQISNPDNAAKKHEDNPEPRAEPESSTEDDRQPKSFNEHLSSSSNTEEKPSVQESKDKMTRCDSPSKLDKCDAAVPNESGSRESSEDEDIHIDEDTFRAWQNAYAEAEESAMQEQAKASSECFILSIQLVILCLIVGKVDQSYGSEYPNDVGFSAFWILFPFFLFFGIICCCCTLLIYGAAPGSAEDLNETPAENVLDTENPPNAQKPTLVLPHVHEEKKTESVEQAYSKEKQDGMDIEAPDEEKAKPSGTGDIDDLD
jgi:hypothetical protein